jgi:hypothetical protein
VSTALSPKTPTPAAMIARTTRGGTRRHVPRPLQWWRFDLALCLEVAEHLPAAAGDSLVRRLASVGARILFSAAIPGQGGRNHVNEKWPQR